mmetsp:Transcript_12550/g.34525  ORF Transcript_12550/g.34525 Transcript_12550/m.34525 type:complete len:176 (-) Transcript_12550:639-1166(-)
MITRRAIMAEAHRRQEKEKVKKEAKRRKEEELARARKIQHAVVEEHRMQLEVKHWTQSEAKRRAAAAQAKKEAEKRILQFEKEQADTGCKAVPQTLNIHTVLYDSDEAQKLVQRLGSAKYFKLSDPTLEFECYVSASSSGKALVDFIRYPDELDDDELWSVIRSELARIASLTDS